jgi:hypothetical protein
VLEAAAWGAAALAALPAVLLAANLPLLRRPRPAPAETGREAPISVLIPARDEERNIGAALESVLQETRADLEVLVLDDDSGDATAALVARYAAHDSRVRLLRGEPLPPGAWGKPSACARLAEAARGAELVFMDADVCLAPGALRRLRAERVRSGAALLSGVPRQVTLGFGERLVVPLIHFVLLGFLPLLAMRRSLHPAFGVACGQLMIVERSAYFAAGGHRAVADKIHDGMALARALRRAGFRTELADFTRVARCRMYRSWREVANGFAKNAHEGLGSPGGIVPWTLLLFGGQTAWVALAPLAFSGAVPAAPVVLAAALSLGARAAVALRFAQPLASVSFHPLGVAVLVALQWWALWRRRRGRPVAWKRRTALPAAVTPAVPAQYSDGCLPQRKPSSAPTSSSTCCNKRSAIRPPSCSHSGL